MAGAPAIRSHASAESQRGQQLHQLVGLHGWCVGGRTGQSARSRPEISEGAAAAGPDAGVPPYAPGPRGSCAVVSVTESRLWRRDACGE